MAQTRAGISAKQLERELGVTYKTAWRMFHQIRKMMADDGTKLTGEVEVDEAYLQPNSHFTRKGTPKYSKYKKGNNQIILGAVERGGRVKAKHIPEAGVRVIPEVEDMVDKSAHVYSDSYPAYKRLKGLGYTHESVAHMEGVFKVGEIHTQNIENFWSNMKRGIRGVYRHVDPKYLQNYADEYAFRYSHRNSPSMFWSLLGRIVKS
jgi:transposase